MERSYTYDRHQNVTATSGHRILQTQSGYI